MERLTERIADGILVKENHVENGLRTFYQRFEEKPNDKYTNCDEGYCAIEKLAAYEDAEEQGLLLRLPCKLGDIAYEITGATTRGYDWKYLTYEKAYIHGTVFNLSRLHDIGKTIFLTKEEAEEKLKELKEMEGAE